MPKQVREPIQVYLTEEERVQLDELASRLGVSRSEILRRGIGSLYRFAMPPPLDDLAQAGLITPARVREGTPPAGRPVMPLAGLMDELDDDRADR